MFCWQQQQKFWYDLLLYIVTWMSCKQMSNASREIWIRGSKSFFKLPMGSLMSISCWIRSDAVMVCSSTLKAKEDRENKFRCEFSACARVCYSNYPSLAYFSSRHACFSRSSISISIISSGSLLAILYDAVPNCRRVMKDMLNCTLCKLQPINRTKNLQGTINYIVNAVFLVFCFLRFSH